MAKRRCGLVTLRNSLTNGTNDRLPQDDYSFEVVECDRIIGPKGGLEFVNIIEVRE